MYYIDKWGFWLLVATATLQHLDFATAQQIPQQLLFVSHTLNDADAVCNDGSPAVMFFRNCSANWDRKPGGPDFCNVSNRVFTIVYHNGDRSFIEPGAGDANYGARGAATGTTANIVQLSGAYCYNEASCLQRERNLTTSIGLPTSVFVDGIVLPYAEANPNLYKSADVIVPYCSSDLWLGNGNTTFQGQKWEFRGAAIVRAVIRALFNDLPSGQSTLATADTILIVGHAGVMSQLDSIVQYIEEGRAQTPNASAAVSIAALCDACSLVDVPVPAPPLPVSERSRTATLCTTDANCPPRIALATAWSFWSPSQFVVGSSCNNRSEPWLCLLAPALVSHLSRPNASVPALIQQQQFDAVQLASYGVWPLNSSASIQWAERVFAPAVLEAVASAPYTFLPACSLPSQLTLSPAYYHTTVRTVDAYNFTLQDAFSVAVPTFLDAIAPGGGGSASYGIFADNCSTLECNGSGCRV